MYNELEEIEEIISKIDNIKLEEWEKREDETNEEFEERIQTIEDDIEEELIDYISDSLLREQEIDIIEAEKEAREKIVKECEIYEDAFEKDLNGKLTLKEVEELEKNGYTTDEEIEKLNSVLENYNDPNKYIEKINKNIEEKRDIESELERKLEIAKMYILAKLRGQKPTINNEKQSIINKISNNNQYIQSSKQLNKVPLVQNEVINSNRLVEKIHNNNLNNRSNQVTPVINRNNGVVNNYKTQDSQLVSKMPTKKSEVFYSLEKKMDKGNDEIKQKILARTELKKVFHEYDKNSNGDVDIFKNKIEEIKIKFPNIVNDDLINKIARNYNITFDDKKVEKIKTEKEAKEDSDNNKHISNNPNDKRLEEVLRILKLCENDVLYEIPGSKLNFVASYLSNNDNNEVKEQFKEAISKIEKFNGEDFLQQIEKLDINFNISIFDQMYSFYSKGLTVANGETIISKDLDKAKEYLFKEIRYLGYLKNKAEIKSDNPIENLKNEARLSSALSEIEHSNLRKKAPAINLVLSAEKLKRVNNEYNYNRLVNMLTEYKEKMKNNESISVPELETLGEIMYNGITNSFGDIILTPDKIKAKDIYFKLTNEYETISSPVSYNRLYSLYSDKTLPIFDTQKAEKVKEKMKQKKIQIKKENKHNNQGNKQTSSTYVCSDLHGEYSVYKTIVDQLKENDKLYILGDVFDGFDGGVKIIRDIMSRKESGQVEFLIGNHELFPLLTEKVFDRLEENPNLKYNSNDYTNLQETTFNELKALENKERTAIKEFLYNSLAYKELEINNQKYYLTHAKAIDDSDKKEETVKEMIETGREKLLKHAIQYREENNDYSNIQKDGIFTIIGHTPTDNTKFIEYKTPGVLYIDCRGSSDKEALLRLEDGKVMYFDTNKAREKNKKELSK